MKSIDITVFLRIDYDNCLADSAIAKTRHRIQQHSFIGTDHTPCITFGSNSPTLTTTTDSQLHSTQPVLHIATSLVMCQRQLAPLTSSPCCTILWLKGDDIFCSLAATTVPKHLHSFSSYELQGSSQSARPSLGYPGAPLTPQYFYSNFRHLLY